MMFHVEQPKIRTMANADPLSAKQLDALAAWAADARNLGLFPELTEALPLLVAEVQWFRARAVERGKAAARAAR